MTINTLTNSYPGPSPYTTYEYDSLLYVTLTDLMLTNACPPIIPINNPLIVSSGELIINVKL